MGAAEPSPGFFPVAGDLINGKYEIERLLGRGGMGAVFAAQNRMTGRRVALKWVLPERATPGSRERLLREARATCAVNHPNVVQVFDVCEHQDGLFLVMEYLDGRSLGDLLESCGPLDPADLIGLLMPTLRGVQAAHDAGVVHRDLKPDNILLCPLQTGELLPKVLDFGVSKTFDAERRLDTSLTHTGALVGTPHFMALEQVDGSGDIDVRTDVYAFGVILYLGLTGHAPFDGDTLGELILKIGTRTPLNVRAHRPHLPAALDRVVLKAIARAREQRFSSVRELGEALEPFADGARFTRESADTTAPSLPSRLPGRTGPVPSASPRTGHSKRWAARLSLGMLVALCLAAWIALRSEPSQATGGDPSQKRSRPSAPGASSAAWRSPNAARPRVQPLFELELPSPPSSPREDRAQTPTGGSEVRAEGEDPGPPDVAPSRERDADGTRGATEARSARPPRHARGRGTTAGGSREPERITPSEERIRGQRTPGLSASEF